MIPPFLFFIHSYNNKSPTPPFCFLSLSRSHISGMNSLGRGATNQTNQHHSNKIPKECRLIKNPMYPSVFDEVEASLIDRHLFGAPRGGCCGFGYAAGETQTDLAGAGRYPPYSPSTLLARALGLCSPPYLHIEDEHIASASPIEASCSQPFERGVR